MKITYSKITSAEIEEKIKELNKKETAPIKDKAYKREEILKSFLIAVLVVICLILASAPMVLSVPLWMKTALSAIILLFGTPLILVFGILATDRVLPCHEKTNRLYSEFRSLYKQLETFYADVKHIEDSIRKDMPEGENKGEFLISNNKLSYRIIRNGLVIENEYHFLKGEEEKASKTGELDFTYLDKQYENILLRLSLLKKESDFMPKFTPEAHALHAGDKVIITGGTKKDWVRTGVPEPYYVHDEMDDSLVVQAYKNKEICTVTAVNEGEEGMEYDILHPSGKKLLGFYGWELERVKELSLERVKEPSLPLSHAGLLAILDDYWEQKQTDAFARHAPDDYRNVVTACLSYLYPMEEYRRKLVEYETTRKVPCLSFSERQRDCMVACFRHIINGYLLDALHECYDTIYNYHENANCEIQINESMLYFIMLRFMKEAIEEKRYHCDEEGKLVWSYECILHP